MKISFARGSMYEQLHLAKMLCSNLRPALSCVKLVAEESLEVMSTNLEMAYCGRPRMVNVREPGECLVPAEQLHDVVGSCDSCSLAVAGKHVELAADGSHWELSTCDPAEMNDVVFAEQWHITLPAMDLRAALGRVMVAAGEAGIVKAGNVPGVVMESDNGLLRVLSVDGRRVAIEELKADCPLQMPFIVPELSVKVLRVMLNNDEGDVHITPTANNAIFTTDTGSLHCRLAASRVPNWRVVLRDAYAVVKVQREAMLAGLKKVLLVTTEENNRVDFQVADAKLTLSAASIGRATATVDVANPEGTRFAARLSGVYLRDFFSAMPAEAVVDVCYAPDNAPVLFRWQNHRHAIAQMS